MQISRRPEGHKRFRWGDAARRALAALPLAWLAACGGGGGATSAPAPAEAASAVTAGIASGQTLIRLQSDAGDFIGGGAGYAYDNANAAITVSARGTSLRIQVTGRESWSGDFVLPGNAAELSTGTYASLSRYPFQAAGAGALSWTGQGRGCSTVTGTITVLAVTYQGGLLRSLDMDFEQHCEGEVAALRGQVRIGADAMALVSLPQNPLPAAPVVALASDAGDPIGGGASYAYDRSSAAISVSADGNRLSVSVRGDEPWNGEFQLPAGISAWTPGTYTGMTRSPFHAAATGGLSWSGAGSGCNTLTATLVVDQVRYDAGALRAIDLHFEQHCDGAAPALRGSIHWDADLPVPAPAPQPAPAGLWEPPAGTFAPTGNGMYLSSAPGEYIGQGYTWWVGAAAPAPGTGSDPKGKVTVTVTEADGLLRVNVDGLIRWSGEFKAMDGVQHLQPGYYGIVHRYPFHNPARGGLTWTMDSRACNQSVGWFTVDTVTYLGGRLDTLDLRFSQQCDGAPAPLRGRIRWRNTSPAA